MGYSSKNIDHLGIVAGVCKEIGLAQEIDKPVGINEKQIVTTGEAVMAMVINALGFVNRPLYLLIAPSLASYLSGLSDIYLKQFGGIY